VRVCCPRKCNQVGGFALEHSLSRDHPIGEPPLRFICNTDETETCAVFRRVLPSDARSRINRAAPSRQIKSDPKNFVLFLVLGRRERDHLHSDQIGGRTSFGLVRQTPVVLAKGAVRAIGVQLCDLFEAIPHSDSRPKTSQATNVSRSQKNIIRSRCRRA
jgi:hypothetical protein